MQSASWRIKIQISKRKWQTYLPARQVYMANVKTF